MSFQDLLKIPRADEVREKAVLLEQMCIEEDFTKILEQVAYSLSVCIQSITCNTLFVSLPDFYKDHPKLAQILLSKLLTFFRDREFKIVDLSQDSLGLTFGWRTHNEMLQDLFDEKNDNKEDSARAFSTTDLRARIVCFRQLQYHKQPFLEELNRLKEQVASRIQDAQSQFQYQCTLSLEDCNRDYSNPLFQCLTQALRAAGFQIVPSTGEQQIKISWDPDPKPDRDDVAKTKVEPPICVAPPVPETPTQKTTDHSLDVEFSRMSNDELLQKLMYTSSTHALQVVRNPSNPEASQTEKDQLILYHNEILKRLAS
jgi:hypothetical protein